MMKNPMGDRLSGLGHAPAEERSLVMFLSIVAQFGLLVLLLRQFHLVNAAFHNKIIPLAFAGFIVHHFLPFPLRLPFFLFLSLTGIGLVLGLANGAWLVGIGLVLIAICHLPFSFRKRAAVLLATGAALAVVHTG